MQNLSELDEGMQQNALMFTRNLITKAIRAGHKDGYFKKGFFKKEWTKEEMVAAIMGQEALQQ